MGTSDDSLFVDKMLLSRPPNSFAVLSWSRRGHALSTIAFEFFGQAGAMKSSMGRYTEELKKQMKDLEYLIFIDCLSISGREKGQ